MRMAHKTQYTSWSIAALLFYTIANGFGLYYLQDRLVPAFESLSWIILFILGLGIYRMTDIILFEKVTEPVRDIFVSDEKASKQSSLQKFSTQLFTCNSCFGVWVATVVVYFYILFPIQTLVIMLIMALTGLERFISQACNILEKKGH